MKTCPIFQLPDYLIVTRLVENTIFNLKVRHQTHLFVIIFHTEIVLIYVDVKIVSVRLGQISGIIKQQKTFK